MSELQSLTNRIDTEIAGFQKSVEQFQDTAKSAYEAREARFRDLFVPAANRVVELIRPRLQVLVERFKDRVDITPVVTEHLREVEMRFNSPLAQIDLAFRLSHDMDVKKIDSRSATAYSADPDEVRRTLRSHDAAGQD